MRFFSVEYTDNDKLDCYQLLSILLFRHSSVLGFSTRLPAQPGKQKIVVCLRDSTVVSDMVEQGKVYDEKPYIRRSLLAFREAYPDSEVTETIVGDGGCRLDYYH